MREIKNLDDAFSVLKNRFPDEMTEEEMEIGEKEINKAWKLIESCKSDGLKRIYRELEDIQNENDHFFKLNCSAMLWNIGKFEQVEKIAQIWNNTPLNSQYNYVFYTALEAAATRDSRVIPMLKTCLKDKEGKIDSIHFGTIEWPSTIQFLWGTIGPIGLPYLLEIIKTSNDPTEIIPSITILTECQYLEAIPIIRNLVNHNNQDIKITAIISLGIFGHPVDYAFLISRLSVDNQDVDWNHVYANSPKIDEKIIEKISGYIYALCEYEDLRATPYLIPLLKIKNNELRIEVIEALIYLLTPESLEMLKKYSNETKNAKIQKNIKKFINNLLIVLSISWEKYLGLSSEKKNKLILNYHNERFKKKYIINDIEKYLTHTQLLKIIKEWKRNKSIYILTDEISSKKYNNINEAHIFSVATPEDLSLFLEVRAELCLRLSDECLSEIRDLQILIKLLSRKRYRQIIGITKKVEKI